MLRPRRINAVSSESSAGEGATGRRAQAVEQYYKMSWYSVALVLVCFSVFALLLIGITLSLTVSSPEARYVDFQSFDDDYVFYPKNMVDPVARMIGNAVPPKLARYFAGYLLSCLTENDVTAPAAGRSGRRRTASSRTARS